VYRGDGRARKREREREREGVSKLVSLELST